MKTMKMGLMAVMALVVGVAFFSPRQAMAENIFGTGKSFSLTVDNRSKEDLVFFVDTYCTNGDDYTQVVKAGTKRKLEYSARMSGSCFFDSNRVTLSIKDSRVNLEWKRGGVFGTTARMDYRNPAGENGFEPVIKIDMQHFLTYHGRN